jgi:hypothetical protein
MARCGWEPGKVSADPFRELAAKRFNSWIWTEDSGEGEH